MIMVSVIFKTNCNVFAFLLVVIDSTERINLHIRTFLPFVECFTSSDKLQIIENYIFLM